MHLPHTSHHHHHILFFLILHQLLSLCSSHFCSEGCDLLYNEAFPCPSNLAFIAKNTNIDDIQSIITNTNYLCHTDPTADTAAANNANTDNGIQASDDWDTSSFDLDAHVLLWQCLVISVLVPAMALMLFAILRVLFVRLFELVRCRESSKCGCCLALCSADYRQRRRNRRFDREEIYDEKKSEENGWWRFGANRHRASIEGDDRKEQDNGIVINYQHVALDEDDEDERRKSISQPQNQPIKIEEVPFEAEVLEEVSIERGELDRYLDVPGGNVSGSGQGIELSFSSHGLRQICNREIV